MGKPIRQVIAASLAVIELVCFGLAVPFLAAILLLLSVYA
jgi:hypothetical protein